MEQLQAAWIAKCSVLVHLLVFTRIAMLSCNRKSFGCGSIRDWKLDFCVVIRSIDCRTRKVERN